MMNYPEVVDFEAVSTLIEIVKNRQVGERRKEAALCAWNVAGYLLRISVGAPTSDNPGIIYAHSGQLQDGLEDLHEQLEMFERKYEFSATSQKEAEDIGTVITIISIVLNLLKALGFTKRVREQNNFTASGMKPKGFDEVANQAFREAEGDN